MATAMGIAAAQAAGLKSLFGTMCKPLHAGKAAQNGLFAARLARSGFTARPDILECAQGFAATHGPDLKPEAALADPAGGFHLAKNLFKYHAACYLTHAPIEAARHLRDKHVIDPAEIRAIRLRIDSGADKVCNIRAPRTGLEAKFSLRLTVAFALAGIDTAGLASYDEANAARPDLVRLRDLVDITFVPGWPHTLAELELDLADGRTLAARHDSGVPASDLAAQRRRLEEKFRRLAEPVLGAAAAGRLLEAAGEFEKLPRISTLMQLARTPAE
jgi:2-methylcitrate dehydratase PrpD